MVKHGLRRLSCCGGDGGTVVDLIQLALFVGVTLLIGALTYWQCAKATTNSDNPEKDYFLAGGGLGWIFVAGSITLTNLSTEQLVGMNGNQMLLLAWWELAAVAGLLILAFIFVPLYYRHECVTTTELLEKKYGNKHIRAAIGLLFLLGNIFVQLPVMLYSGTLFLQPLLGIDVPALYVATPLALIGALYAVLGGLRAVAVSDTFSGVGLLGLTILVVILSLKAIDFDLSGIPAERLTLIGGSDTPIPWHTLLTGMLFIQIFYWSTNQTITQRAMAAPSVREAQKGVLVAAGIRLLIVPMIVVVPGIVAFKLYGDIGDAAFGTIVTDVLPGWLSGTFAAMMVAAVLTSFNSALNSSTTLYVCDLHEAYSDRRPNVKNLGAVISFLFVALSLMLVPLYEGTDSIINLVQQLNGLLSMPILSAFIVCLCFRDVRPEAAMTAVIFGTALYAVFTFVWTPLHYIHLMFITLLLSVTVSLMIHRFLLGGQLDLALRAKDRAAST